MIHKRLSKILSVLDNIKMRQKLLLLYFILIILPLSFFTFLTYARISGVMLKQTLNSASQTYQESADILDRDFNSVDKAIEVVTRGNLLYEILSRTYASHDLIDEIKDKQDLSNLFLYLQSNTNLDKIHLYTFGKSSLLEEDSSITDVSFVEKTTWYQTLINSGNNTLWLDPSIQTDYHSQPEDSFGIVRLIYDPENLSQKIGILKLDIKGGRIDSVIRNTLITPHMESYLQDSSRKLRTITSADSDDGFSLSQSQLSELDNRDWTRIKAGKFQSYVRVRSLKLNGWYLISSIPVQDIAATVNKLRNEMLAIMALIFLVAYILAYFISASTIKRLFLLSREMKKVENGQMEVHMKKKGKDEIGDLMENFNFMVSKINTLATEKYKMGIEVKSSELKALQAQINPHFLYNTLELINSTALMKNVPEIATQVTALAKFYRLSLSRGMDVISVQDELEHVKTYVYLQNMRFQNRIKFHINADTEVLACKTLKTILQPIVENSILHGIFEKDDKCGTVTITVIKDNNDIIFTIADDGIGLSQEKLRQVMNQEMPEKSSGGYGIKNIHQRLQLHYGPEYGLTYESRLGIGTKVFVHIPVSYSKIKQIAAKQEGVRIFFN